jgi:ATP-dependent exoDNAse (exonuclease V) alpha subunit
MRSTAENREHLQNPVYATGSAETIQVFERLSSAEGLTERASTFDRRDVICRLFNELPAGVSAAMVLDLADDYLQQPDVVALAETERCGNGYSTAELVALETQVLRQCHDGLGAGAPTANQHTVVRALDDRPSMSGEQRQAVMDITTSGNAVDVMIAGPGTGKTFSLDAAREAWRHSGYSVIGCALSAAAAHQLQSGSGIRSTTIAMLEINLRRHHDWFDPKTVLIVDEAGMVGTRALAPLIDQAAAAGAKVVLVGDTKQLPEIDAGGVLRALEHRHPIVALTENRRQQVPWEREALDDYRAMRVKEAIARLRRHGSLVTGTNADVVRQGMVDEWWRHRQGGRDALMMAHRNVDVDDLNRRARALLAEAHQLQGETIVVSERPFQIGDTVVCLRNDHQRKIRNGTVGEIVTIDHENRSVLLDTTDGLRRLHQEYLDEGWLRHGYAVTVHKAQGLTCEHGLLLASDETHFEVGYVGLSRGTLSNRLYAVSTETDADLERHQRKGSEPERDPISLVTESMTKSAAKDLAVTLAPANAPDPDADYGIDL